MGRITHVEINSDDPDKAVEFYSEVFGWHITKKWSGGEDYWLIHTGSSSESGINGGIRKRISPKASMVPTFVVDSIGKAVTTIESNGGKLAVPKKLVEGTGYIAYCTDPDANLFCILERDTDAKA